MMYTTELERYDKLKESFDKAIVSNDLLHIALLVRQTPKEFYLMYSPLMKAVYLERVEIVEFLLQEKVNMNNVDKALYYASGASPKNVIQLMKLLIEAGANPNAKVEGRLPISHPCIAGNVEAVELLLNAGADPNAQGLSQCTALMHAAYAGQEKVVKLLIKKGANINAQDCDGQTALMYACLAGHFEVVKVLLESGADQNIEDKQGRIAMDYAQQLNSSHVALLLAKY